MDFREVLTNADLNTNKPPSVMLMQSAPYKGLSQIVLHHIRQMNDFLLSVSTLFGLNQRAFLFQKKQKGKI